MTNDVKARFKKPKKERTRTSDLARGIIKKLLKITVGLWRRRRGMLIWTRRQGASLGPINTRLFPLSSGPVLRHHGHFLIFPALTLPFQIFFSNINGTVREQTSILPSTLTMRFLLIFLFEVCESPTQRTSDLISANFQACPAAPPQCFVCSRFQLFGSADRNGE